MTRIPFHPLPLKVPISLRNLLLALYLGAIIPLLVGIGLVVYGLQQSFLVNDAQKRLQAFVNADVAAMNSNDLTFLALSLAQDLRVFGADVFVKDFTGKPIPPALGTGPWLNEDQHRQAREFRQGSLQTIRTPLQNALRLIYLTPVVDEKNQVMGTVEASLPLDPIDAELNALRRWLTLILGLAAALSVLLVSGIAWMATRPLQSLVETARRVSHGDMDYRAELPMISEVRLVSETLNTMLDRIQSALQRQSAITEEMRRFAADASHELRSPLAVLRSATELLDRAVAQGNQDETGEILAMLHQEINAMGDLVDNLLFLARLDQNVIGNSGSLNLVPLDPLPLLEEIYERAQMLAEGQILQLEWPNSELPAINADREMLRRALNNLVENALKYTLPGKTIHLSASAENSGCRFDVNDEGIGISNTQLAHIFDRFYRADSSRSRRQPGTGLGLSIVQAIAQAHGGYVTVQSEEDQGSTFSLVIPYAPPAITG